MEKLTLKTRKQAFSLIEIIVAISIVGIVLASLFGGFIGGRKAVKRGMTHLERLGQINRILEYCKRGLRFAKSIEKELTPSQCKYTINYVNKFKADGINWENSKLILNSTISNGKTRLVITYQGKDQIYLLEGINFSFSLQKNLAIIKLTYIDGKRPPIVLSLFAPFLNGDALEVIESSSTGSLQVSSTNSESNIEYNSVQFNDEDESSNEETTINATNDAPTNQNQNIIPPQKNNPVILMNFYEHWSPFKEQILN